MARFLVDGSGEKGGEGGAVIRSSARRERVVRERVFRKDNICSFPLGK